MHATPILQSTPARLGGLAVALMVLAGCGQKGALFLPAAASAPAPALAASEAVR